MRSAQDADTDGVEGLTYTWTPDEAAAPESRAGCCEPFEHGRFVLRGELEPALRERLLGVRDGAPAAVPRRQGDRLLERPRARRAGRGRLPARARRLARGSPSVGGVPARAAVGRRRAACCRSLRDGRTSGHGFLDDYANVAHGLLELHVATGELRWLHEARRLALLAVELFADDERGGFFLSAADGDARVPRTKDLQDTPTPSGNSMLAWVLLRLARLWGDDELERRRSAVFRLVEPAVRARPGSVRLGARAVSTSGSAHRASSPSPGRRLAGGTGCAHALPAAAVVAVGPADDVPLLAGKGLVDGSPPSTSASGSPASAPPPIRRAGRCA